MTNKLDSIHSPADLRNCSKAELDDLAIELRQFLLDSVSKTGGHWSSNLGTVELTIALHYVIKNGFKSVILGLSGGIDSALVAAIACDALGADKVYGIALPSKYSSTHSLNDAKQTAINTGLNFRVIEIEPMVQSFVSNLHLTVS